MALFDMVRSLWPRGREPLPDPSAIRIAALDRQIEQALRQRRLDRAQRQACAREREIAKVHQRFANDPLVRGHPQSAAAPRIRTAQSRAGRGATQGE